jgi:hypothetical protein
MKKQRLIWLSLGLMMAMALLAVSLAGAAGPGEDEEILADANDNPVPIPPQTAPVIECPAGTTPAAFYFSDLEANDGGWVASGPANFWEYGVILPGVYEICDTAPRPEPTGAYSGVNVWGTNLNGCYPNAGADGILSQSFDFSALSAPIELDWQHWYEVFETFDYAIVRANGDQLWRTPNSNPTADWTQQVVSLAAYAGNPNVTIEFLLHATTVVNRMGWYLDDIAINYCQPAAQAEISLNKTVGTDPNVCAATSNISVPSGTDVTYCYEVTNTGTVSLTVHDLDDSELGTIFSGLVYDLGPGAGVFVTETTTIVTDTVNVATWTACNFDGPPGSSCDDQGAFDVVTATATANVEITPLSISLNKTVGLDPGVCATTDAITIPAGYGGTTVYYCYEVTNTGTVALPLHTLDDSELGNIFTDLAYDLGPGESVDTVAAGLEISALITETTVNTAVWTASIPGGPSVTATDSATVTRGNPTGVALSGFGADVAAATPLWLAGLLILLLVSGLILRRKTSA